MKNFIPFIPCLIFIIFLIFKAWLKSRRIVETKYFYCAGNFHREDGPAIIEYQNGVVNEIWYCSGIKGKFWYNSNLDYPIK